MLRSVHGIVLSKIFNIRLNECAMDDDKNDECAMDDDKNDEHTLRMSLKNLF